jgi:hypothetical protein
MTKQHKATPDDWAQQEDWANRSVFSDSSCIIELRDRIEALEVRQLITHGITAEEVAPSSPAGSLVERIATDAELCQVYNDAPEHGFGPALRAVYDLGREHGAAPTQPGPESPLVERVADAIAAQATSAGIVNDRPARAAILEVATWLREQDGVGLLAATVLTREANR